MVEKADFDVLGHIGYPLRYIQGRAGISLMFLSLQKRLLSYSGVSWGGKGIELNTSGLRQP